MSAVRTAATAQSLDLKGKRATVMGLGTRGGGVGVARYLAAGGALVTVTDGKPAAELAAPLAELAGLPIRYVLGGHDEADFAEADLVVRNPGVRRDHSLLALARARGVPVEMEMSLFLRACPAPVAGVTGTKGKTTVATLAGALLTAWNPTTVVAGNMGISALARLPEIEPETPVVLELSSWQLEATAEHGLSPHLSVITNVAEDHLNTYQDFAEYGATKRSIAACQRPDDWAVLPIDDPEAWRAADQTAARVVPFGAGDRGMDGAWAEPDRVVWRLDGEVLEAPLPTGDPFLGEHARVNAAAAVAIARLMGATSEAVATGLAGFRGVRDRMEPVMAIDDVRYINDTTATAPVAAAAALRALAGTRVHLLAGGANKGLDPAPLAEAAADHGAVVYLFDGTATPRLADALRARGVEPHGPYGSMADAIAAARDAAQPGSVVLLSPGCASFGLFRDEFDRGEQFRAIVRALAAEDGGGGQA